MVGETFTMDPHTEEERLYIEYLVKKYVFRLGSKEDNYRIYRC